MAGISWPLNFFELQYYSAKDIINQCLIYILMQKYFLCCLFQWEGGEVELMTQAHADFKGTLTAL